MKFAQAGELLMWYYTNRFHENLGEHIHGLLRQETILCF